MTTDRSLAIDGFVSLRAFASAQELDVLRAAVAGLAGASHDGACKRPHNTLLPLRWEHPIVELLLSDPERVANVRTATSANDLRWISGYVSIKEARTPALWWHQDWWCWDHPVSFGVAAPQVALLLYLSNTDRANGALRVLPGSHRRSAPIHALLPEAHGSDAEGLDPTHPALADLPEQATLALRAGDAAVLDYRLLHGTHANASPVRRDALLMTFTPSWRDLPDDVRGHLIDHPALPTEQEAPPSSSWGTHLLPHFDGRRTTLPLNRNAPSAFAVSG
jgi:ectoine hydroxylase-related dioxygenase (phytanoyl-CoA dioxygenase family)